MTNGAAPPSASGHQAFGLDEAELDRGWDDELPATSTARPETSARTPDPPTSVTSPRLQSQPVQAAPSTFAVQRDAGTLRPSEVEPEVLGTRRRSLARFVATLGIAASMVLASLAWLKDGGKTVSSQIADLFAKQSPPPAAPAAEPTPSEAVAESGTESESPLPPGAVITAIAPGPAVPPIPVAPPPAPENSAAASVPKGASRLVTVKTVPAGAVIFQAGKRLGTGVVELEMAPKTKRRLTALLDGHRPVNFTVDGSRDAVTVMLKPMPRTPPEAAPPEEAPLSD
jgi:hypothetical protein